MPEQNPFKPEEDRQDGQPDRKRIRYTPELN